MDDGFAGCVLLKKGKNFSLFLSANTPRKLSFN